MKRLGVQNLSVFDQPEKSVVECLFLGTTCLVVSVSLLLLPVESAQAQFNVIAPEAERGVGEFEVNSAVLFGYEEEAGEEEELQNFGIEFAVGYGVTNFWKPEFAIEIEQTVDGESTVPVFALENTFVMLRQSDKFPLDLGFFAAYEGLVDEDFDVIEFGPIVRFQTGKFTTTFNPFLERQIGLNAEEDFAFSYSAQSLYEVNDEVAVGIEIFGEVEAITGNTPSFNQQELRLGPVLEASLGETGLGANVGMLFGVTEATSDFAFKLNLEYELE